MMSVPSALSGVSPTAPRWRRWLLPVAMVAAVAACSETPRGQGEGAVTNVTAHEVATDEWVDAIEALGTAQARESVTITAKVTEVVRHIRFEDGDVVNEGDILVELTGQAEVANLREAQASLNEAQQQLDRLEPLVAQGTIPRAELDRQRAARDTARARADAIRARLAERVISAPFAGVLGFREVSSGALVTPGTVIATLDDVSTIKLDFRVPETLLSSLAVGQQIAARSGAWPEREFTGTVSSVGSRVDPVSRSVTVRADLPNPDALIKPGMLMAVSLMTEPRRTLVIPELALTQVGTNQSVYRIGDDDTVSQVGVRTGARRRGEVEILDGLEAGDLIVLHGTGKLRDGARVAIVEQPVAAARVAAGETPAARPATVN